MIDASIYLQVDATAIAGIFILLTIGSLFKPDKMHETIIQKIWKYEVYTSLQGAVMIMIVPFALSAIAIIIDDGLYPDIISIVGVHNFFKFTGISMSAVGFAYIVWIIYAINQHHERISNKK